MDHKEMSDLSKLDKWINQEPVLDFHKTERANILVLRDDLLEGGSKMRFLPYLLEGADEVVFGGPFCGAAPLAMSVWARETGKKATLFYASRQNLHPRQIAAEKNGATLKFCTPGYMTVVQRRAQDYAKEKGARFLPLGFDVPQAIAPLEHTALLVKHIIQSQFTELDQVWCTCGSGMLTRIVARVFAPVPVWGVAVGLRSRHGVQDFPENVTILDSPYKFQEPCKIKAPFPSCPYYDLKGWEKCTKLARGNVLFWNVAGVC